MSGRRWHIAHLVRRFVGSAVPRPVRRRDAAWVAAVLSPAELDLWRSMSTADRRHSAHVARRFVERLPDATRAEVAGALLHDVGKIASGLGTVGRVVATVVGPRTDRFRRYHDHERIGAQLLDGAGADPTTVELVAGRGRAAMALRAADAI